jgi:uncharacterized membrane protein YjgN (DUF898 family)
MLIQYTFDKIKSFCKVGDDNQLLLLLLTILSHTSNKLHLVALLLSAILMALLPLIIVKSVRFK